MPQLSRKIKQSLIPIERIEHAILLIRGVKVILDTNLAILYEVQTRVLTQAVKRHRRRFPSDFMFQLTKKESDFLRSQIVTQVSGVDDAISLMLSRNRV